ncbi:hypothetical protein CABS02_15066 [Colletotrichum abscissum]|uniref:Uncharacterized protein n=1 Tax=Colletotrichum abscissum TaxID=1671311 RepID=A0A9P9X054_9PEZI|nr:hypothetical protein CABS02_15066 [Colletotrichum abscissum]
MEGCNKYHIQHIYGFQEAYDNLYEHHEIPLSSELAEIDDQELAYVPDFETRQDLLGLLTSSRAADTVAFSPNAALLNFESVGTEYQQPRTLKHESLPPSPLPSLCEEPSSVACHDEEAAVTDDTTCVNPSVLLHQPDERSLRSWIDNHDGCMYFDPGSAECAIVLLRCHHEGNKSPSVSTQASSSPLTSGTTRRLYAEMSALASPEISLTTPSRRYPNAQASSSRPAQPGNISPAESDFSS